MRERFMLTTEDRGYLHSNLTHKRVDYLLDLVDKRSLHLKFLESVRSETTHLGHGYVKTLLQDTYYCSDDDLHRSADIRRKVESNLTKMMDIDLPSLIPLLCEQLLLTRDERTLLTTKSEVENQNTLQFFDILDTKGPLAYLKFVHCLSREKSHPAHNELYKMLCQATDEEELAIVVCGGPTKRRPNRLVLEGPLVQKKYKQLFEGIKKKMYSGDWVAVKRGVDKCMRSEIPEVRVIGLLEDAGSWALRSESARALSIISQAIKLCQTKVNETIAVFLEARAYSKLSAMYRYLKQYEKSLECATRSMELLFNAEPGEYSSYANYNHACTLKCMLKSNPSNAAQIMREFTFAVDVSLVDQATSCCINEWSKIVAEKSLIHQAMLLLDSNENIPGITDRTRQENIAKASSSLSKLDVPSLSNRIRCLYNLAVCELHTQKKEVDCANKAASDARRLANKCGFAHLFHSANSKLIF